MLASSSMNVPSAKRCFGLSQGTVVYSALTVLCLVRRSKHLENQDAAKIQPKTMLSPREAKPSGCPPHTLVFARAFAGPLLLVVGFRFDKLDRSFLDALYGAASA